MFNLNNKPLFLLGLYMSYNYYYVNYVNVKKEGSVPSLIFYFLLSASNLSIILSL